jgi:uncharacterized protein YeaO (DUF488 family)
MAISVVRLGTARGAGEGLRLGTVRHPPRGVRKEDWARRDWFDVWLPDLAPSAELVSFALARPFTPSRWATFARRYRREMQAPAAQRLLALLAALSRRTDVAVGCYCEDEAHCHRALLRELLRDHGGLIRQRTGPRR